MSLRTQYLHTFYDLMKFINMEVLNSPHDYL
ncbi:protein of unknown function [Thermococcus camini]|uniref:Uncharacterized protein n=1 Tax=Thermococcus camini TaxID=2016373 RepID=A0A7G2D6N3_9EURY|nr:protein of unknown function [Thermococcus camini]